MSVISGLKRAHSLLDQGRKYLDDGKRVEAEGCFRSAARACAIPAALNNWALCRYLAGDWADARQILSPLLAGYDPAPFSRALAALTYVGQGDHVAARRLLKEAIRDFEVGLARPETRGAASETAWKEYSILIKQAAGALQDHRLVLDLHSRWPMSEYPLGVFMAGVAAFNLQKFEQAARYWQRIANPRWQRLMQAYVRVSNLVADGIVPPFGLEYEPGELEIPKKANEETVRRLVALGSTRVRYLAYLFEPNNEDPAQLVDVLITYTGDWGIELAHRLLRGAKVPMRMKSGAARALTDLGVYAPGEEIPIVHDGRPSKIVLKPLEFQEETPELQRLLAEAVRLRDAGRGEEAYRMLSDLYLQGVAFPPAMITLANLMRSRGELEPARSILETLDKAFPDEPAILFNQAGLWMQLGDVAKARQFARRIRPEGMGPAFKERLAELEAALEQQELAGLWDSGRMGDLYRDAQDQRPISPEVKVGTALKQVPVQWLNAMADRYGVPSARRRPEREKHVIAALADPKQIRRALGAEAEEVCAALRYVLEQGGWCKLQGLTKRWGTQEGDGFWWDEQPPASIIGRLRMLGLLFVGRHDIGGRRHKVAVVPLDLRRTLDEVLP